LTGCRTGLRAGALTGYGRAGGNEPAAQPGPRAEKSAAASAIVPGLRGGPGEALRGSPRPVIGHPSPDDEQVVVGRLAVVPRAIHFVLL
jgi:hypothetical protein